MKSEHRHELKTNALAQWISDMPEWSKENRRTIILVSVLTVVFVGYLFLYGHKKKAINIEEQTELTNLIVKRMSNAKVQSIQAQSQGFDNALEFMQVSDALYKFSKKTKNDDRSALALIKAAELLRTELHYRLDPPPSTDIKIQIDKAVGYYEQAIKKTGKNPGLAAMAKFGLGLCQEELGNFSGAKEIYTEIADSEDFEGTATALEAEFRLAEMDEYKTRVIFKASEIKPVEMPVPQMDLKPLDIDVNFMTP